MAKVKQIINCETNRKFILIYDDGGIIVPDVNFYVLMDDGKVVVYPEMINGDHPVVGKELPEERYRCRVEKYIGYNQIKRCIITQEDKDLSGTELDIRVKEILGEIKHQLPDIGNFFV